VGHDDARFRVTPLHRRYQLEAGARGEAQVEDDAVEARRIQRRERVRQV
jgi:hypothetical protein